MSYCHRCGKKANHEDTFCAHCGAKIGEFIEEIKEEVEEIVQKTKRKKPIKTIIFLFIIAYIILDLWAMTQLTPVATIDSALSSASNFDADTSLSKTTISSSMRLENPTFVPILFGKISYEAFYGNTKVADGKTGFFVIGPYSQNDIPVDLTIYHVESLWSGAKWIWNAITGNQERKYINLYADFELFKFKIGVIE